MNNLYAIEKRLHLWGCDGAPFVVPELKHNEEIGLKYKTLSYSDQIAFILVDEPRTFSHRPPASPPPARAAVLSRAAAGHAQRLDA